MIQKINEKLEKNIKLVIISFLFLQPIMDVLAAISINVFNVDTTASSIIRLIFLGFCIYYLIFLDKTKNKKKHLIFTGSVILYIIMFAFITLYYKGTGAFVYEIRNTLNTFYLPIILISFLDMFKQYKIKLDLKKIVILYFIYLLFVTIPNLTNAGFASYAHSKTGNVGWFLSANAVGNILSILLPLIILYLTKIDTKKIYKVIIVILTLYVFASMGTKVPILSLGICALVNFVYYFIYCFKQKKYTYNIVMSIIAGISIIASIIIIPKTSFYKNIQIHKDFLGFDNYLEVFTNYELLDHFIFSQRLTFLGNTHKLWEKAESLEKILGIGYVENPSTDNTSMKTIEIDYFDLLYRNGIVGFIIYFIIVGPIIINSLKGKIKSIKDLEFKTSIILILLLAIFSGHVLITPAVSIFVALVFILREYGFRETIK